MGYLHITPAEHKRGKIVLEKCVLKKGDKTTILQITTFTTRDVYFLLYAVVIA